jgi:hypothetical protein
MGTFMLDLMLISILFFTLYCLTLYYVIENKPFGILLDMNIDKKKLEEELVKSTQDIFRIYQTLLEDEKTVLKYPEYTKEYLLNFCKKALEEKMTVDKLSRWLGFIQGVLIMNGVLEQEQERTRTRGIFQEIYKKYNIKQEKVDA